MPADTELKDMKRSIFTIVSLAVLLAANASAATAAEGAGSCGKGKVFNPETRTCVAKPKGSGSGSHSG